MLSAINLWLSFGDQFSDSTASQNQTKAFHLCSTSTIVNVYMTRLAAYTSDDKNNLKMPKLHRQNAMLICDFAFLLAIKTPTFHKKQQRPTKFILSAIGVDQRRINHKRMTSLAEWLFRLSLSRSLSSSGCLLFHSIVITAAYMCDGVFAFFVGQIILMTRVWC